MILESNWLRQADESRGRFRSFLLKSLQNFLNHAAEREQALKRGGDLKFISWDDWMAEAPSQLSIPAQALDSLPPERLFDLRWAATVVEQALRRLREECEGKGGCGSSRPCSLNWPRSAAISRMPIFCFTFSPAVRPFVGANVLSVIHQAAATPAPRLRSLALSLDRDLETILARSLERDPKSRYQTAGALADDLERWLEGRPILARRILVPAAPNESIKWRPVGLGKRRERFARGLVRIGLPRLQDDRPMRRLERRAALFQRSGNRFRSDPQGA